jgi:hypothetical protein
MLLESLKQLATASELQEEQLAIPGSISSFIQSATPRTSR